MIEHCRKRGALKGTELEHRWLKVLISKGDQDTDKEVKENRIAFATDYGRFKEYTGDEAIAEEVVKEIKASGAEVEVDGNNLYHYNTQVWTVQGNQMFASQQTAHLKEHLLYGYCFKHKDKQNDNEYLYCMYGSALYPFELYSYDVLIGSEANRQTFGADKLKENATYEGNQEAMEIVAKNFSKLGFNEGEDAERTDSALAPAGDRGSAREDKQSWTESVLNVMSSVLSPGETIANRITAATDAAWSSAYLEFDARFQAAANHRVSKAATAVILAGTEAVSNAVYPLTNPIVKVDVMRRFMVDFDHMSQIGHLKLGLGAQAVGCANQRVANLALLQNAETASGIQEVDSSGRWNPNGRIAMFNSMGLGEPTYMFPEQFVHSKTNRMRLDRFDQMNTGGQFQGSEYYNDPNAGWKLLNDLVHDKPEAYLLLTNMNSGLRSEKAKALKKADASFNYINSIPSFLKLDPTEASNRSSCSAYYAPFSNMAVGATNAMDTIGSRLGEISRDFCSAGRGTVHHREGVVFSMLSMLVFQPYIENIPSTLLEIGSVGLNLERAFRFGRRIVDEYMLQSPRMVMRHSVSILPVITQAYLTIQLQSGSVVESNSYQWWAMNAVSIGAQFMMARAIPKIYELVGTDAAILAKENDEFFLIPKDDNGTARATARATAELGDGDMPASAIPLNKHNRFRFPNMMPTGHSRTPPLRQELRYHLLMLTKKYDEEKTNLFKELKSETDPDRFKIELPTYKRPYWKQGGFGRVVRYFSETAYVATMGHLQAQRLFGQLKNHGEKDTQEDTRKELCAQSAFFDDTVLSDVMRDLRARGAPVPAHPTRLQTDQNEPTYTYSTPQGRTKSRDGATGQPSDAAPAPAQNPGSGDITGDQRVIRVRLEAAALMRRAFVANAMVEWPEFNEFLRKEQESGDVSFCFQESAGWAATVGTSATFYLLTGPKNIFSSSCDPYMKEQLRKAVAVAPLLNRARNSELVPSLVKKQFLNEWQNKYKQKDDNFKITSTNMPSMWLALQYMLEGEDMPRYDENKMTYFELKSRNGASSSTDTTDTTGRIKMKDDKKAKISTALLNRTIHRDRSATTFSQRFLKSWLWQHPNQPGHAFSFPWSRMPEMCMEPHFAQKLLHGDLFGSESNTVADISEPKLRGVPSRAMVDIVEGLLSPKLAEFALISQRAIGAAEALIGAEGRYSLNRGRTGSGSTTAYQEHKDVETKNALRAARLTVDELRWDRHVPVDHNENEWQNLPWAHMRETALTLTGELVLCMCRHGHGEDLNKATKEWLDELKLLFTQSKYEDSGVELMGYVEKLDVRRDVVMSKQGRISAPEPKERTAMVVWRDFVEGPDKFPGMKDVCNHQPSRDNGPDPAMTLVKLLSASIIKCRALRKSMHREDKTQVDAYLKKLVQSEQYGCFIFRTPYNVLLPGSCVPSALHRNSRRDGRVGTSTAPTRYSRIGAQMIRDTKSTLSSTLVSQIWQTVEDNSIIGLAGAAMTSLPGAAITAGVMAVSALTVAGIGTVCHYVSRWRRDRNMSAYYENDNDETVG